MSFKLINLKIKVDDKEVVHGLSLEINPGEVHVIMGPNGSGKSTLANTLMGHPKYQVVSGKIELDGQNITDASPDQRAQKGLYLSMQYPPEINGITIVNFLRTAYNALHEKKLNPVEFHSLLKEKMVELGFDQEMARRYVNVGFSGGEKKRMEVLQLATLQPKYAILDETDSGLDVDALKVVAEGINKYKSKDKGVLIITHYSRILEYINPDYVHIMRNGVIEKTGDISLAHEIEKKGYTI